MTPNKDQNTIETDKVGSINIIKSSEIPVKRRTKQELRDLWKKAINQQLILIRMEKENAKLRGIKTSFINKNCVNPPMYIMQFLCCTNKFLLNLKF